MASSRSSTPLLLLSSVLLLALLALLSPVSAIERLAVHANAAQAPLLEAAPPRNSVPAANRGTKSVKKYNSGLRYDDELAAIKACDESHGCNSAGDGHADGNVPGGNGQMSQCNAEACDEKPCHEDGGKMCGYCWVCDVNRASTNTQR